MDGWMNCQTQSMVIDEWRSQWTGDLKQNCWVNTNQYEQHHSTDNKKPL